VTAAARLLLPALRWREETGFAHEGDAAARALDLGVGGFIIFGGTADAVRALTADLRTRAGRPLLLAADLERGAGQQFAGLTEFPPPAALASLDDPAAIRWAATTTAREARSVGVRWVLAPVADLDNEPRNPIVQTRAFSADAADAAAAVAAWVAGCAAGGALSCVKHWPGHGRTTADSHDGAPAVFARARELGEDLLPFEAGIRAGASAVMTAHVAFPALDASGVPATFSGPILSHLRAGGFDGPVVTDALIMEGALAGGEDPPAVRALRAGCDLLLYPPDPAGALTEIAAALAQGRLPPSRIAEALRRYEGLLRQAESAEPVETSGAPPYPSSAALADALLTRGVVRGAPPPALRGPISLAVVDDDVGGRWPAGPADRTEQALRAAGVAVGRGGDRIVLAFAEPRASKGRAGFSAENRRRLGELAGAARVVILFGHPRLAEEIPGTAPVLLAWHRQRLMQEAAARWIAGRTG
jgi:beta-glucosidase-like glycosyl hydrolase